MATSSSPQTPASELRGVRAAYAPLRVYASELSIRLLAGGAAGGEATVSFEWNWRLADDTLNVLFGIKVDPYAGRNEEVRAVMVGVFSLPDEAPVPLDAFVAQNAVVTLFPFLREAVSSLTMHGYHGPTLIPLVNAVSLARQFDARETDGFRQLAADSTLRRKVARLLSPEFTTALADQPTESMAELGDKTTTGRRRAGAASRNSVKKAR